MTDHSSNANRDPNERPRRYRRLCHGLMAATAVAGAAAIVLYLAFPGVAAARGWLAAPGCHHHGPWGRNEGDSPSARVRAMAERALDRLEATDDQRVRVLAILDAATSDLSELGAERAANREAFLEALTAPAVDRSVLEALRVRKLDGMSRASQRIVQAVGDVADVLTIDQRSKLVEHLRRMHG